MSELQVVREIEAINHLLSRHGKTGMVDVESSFVSSKGDLCRYVIYSTERVNIIKSFVPEVQQTITGLRGQKTTVDYDEYYGAFVMVHPHPTNLMWDSAVLDELMPLQFVAGRQYEGHRSELLTYDLNDARYAHVLISGTTGSGKTSLMGSLLTSLGHSTSPERLRFIFIDPKNSEYMRPLSKLPHTHLLVRDPDEATQVMVAVSNELGRRKEEGRKPDYTLVVFVDELADLIKSGGDDVLDSLNHITRIGREYGVHIIGATQKVLVEIVGSATKANMPLRFLGRMVSTSDSSSAAGNGAQTNMIETPGVFYAVSGEPIRIRTYYITNEALQLEIERIQERWIDALPAPVNLPTATKIIQSTGVSFDQVLSVLREYGLNKILKEDGAPVRGIKTKIAEHLYNQRYAGETTTKNVDAVIDGIRQIQLSIQ